MHFPFQFHPEFIIRTPRYPASAAIATTIEELISDPAFLEAIYLASPVLYRACLKYREGKMQDSKAIVRLQKSLLKYYLRSVHRSTPFGLFSGCGIGKWKESTNNLVLDTTIQRHTRFDMYYLCALAQQLATLPGIKEYLKYFPNNSLYKIADEIRYVEYNFYAQRRIHQISSVHVSAYLSKIIEAATEGITLAALVDLLVEPEISKEDALAFINEILEAQLLVSELEPAITGDEFIHQILAILKRIYKDTFNAGLLEITDVLQKAVDLLTKIDTSALHRIEDYQTILTLLDQLGVTYDEARLFQTDIIRHFTSGGLPNHLQPELQEAIEVLLHLNISKGQHTNLHSFIKRFRERYEDREMPLLQVLDTESGIGYLENTGNENVPLVADIVANQSGRTTNEYIFGDVEKYLMKKLEEAYQNGSRIIEISASEIRDLQKKDINQLPPSLHIMFRLVKDYRDLVYIESVGGSSAIALPGRFAHASEKISGMIKDIVAEEETQNPSIIFAEIIHLPESRVGNVLLHPAFRKFEIPYLAQSSVPKEQQIPVQDLVIAVRDGKLILRSQRIRKQIIPRLSTAHNFQQHALPVYQFLCDMQLQAESGGIAFQWGAVAQIVKYLPRVQFKRIILSPATWRFTQPDFSILFHVPAGTSQQERIYAFRKKWHLPQQIVLADADNELFIDFGNEEITSLFLETIKMRKNIELKEFLLPSDQVLTDENGAFYHNQFIAALIKKEVTYKSYPSGMPQVKPVERSFITGSEWLYYKIYCGLQSADKVLTETILPMLMMLTEQKLIDRFFFIRYQDPQFHIRLRINLKSNLYVGQVIGFVYQYLNPYQLNGLIWKIQTDTYQRELERYGTSTIQYAETIFHQDSKAALQILATTEIQKQEEIRWLIVMPGIDDLLDLFGLNIVQKIGIMGVLQNSFLEEFSAGKHLKEQLNYKFRSYRSQIEEIMDSRNDLHSQYKSLFDLLKQKKESLTAVINTLLLEAKKTETTVENLIISFIHMMVNRMITSKARLHELVIYDLLYHYYKIVLAKEKLRSK